MKKISLNRRSFLKNSSKISGFVALSSGMVQLNAFNAWAAKKSSLDSHVAKTMLLVSKDLFPSKKFSDELYMISVDSLDGKAATDESLKKSFVSFKPKYLWIILSMFVSIARTFSPYANERIAFFVYGPTPGKSSKFG